MASMNPNRKSYILSVDPVAYSLTAGTNIPAPLESPPQTPADDIRPPTPGGGPLTSHPTTPDNVPTNLPPTPEPEKQSISNTRAYQPKPDNFRTPMYPASASLNQQPPYTSNGQQQQDQPRRKGVRKLLSLSNLRSSFSSSRTSLNLPRTSHDNQSTISSLKRPASPSMASTTASAWSERPPLREKKSGNWFKRKSGMFLHADMPLDAVDEASSRPDTRDSKRLKESKPTSLLPELSAFGGGGFDDGNLGWDERQFKR